MKHNTASRMGFLATGLSVVVACGCAAEEVDSEYIDSNQEALSNIDPNDVFTNGSTRPTSFPATTGVNTGMTAVGPSINTPTYAESHIYKETTNVSSVTPMKDKVFLLHPLTANAGFKIHLEPCASQCAAVSLIANTVSVSSVRVATHAVRPSR